MNAMTGVSDCQADDLMSMASNQSKGKRDPLVHRITEKQRRDKMNTSLSDLSQLIPDNLLSRKSGGRIEKIDIVMMAIAYIQELAKDNDGLYSHGFISGMSETVRYLASTDTSMDMRDEQDRNQLVAHMTGMLSRRVQNELHQRLAVDGGQVKREFDDEEYESQGQFDGSSPKKRIRAQSTDGFTRKASSASSSESYADLAVGPTPSPEPVAQLCPPGAMDYKKKIKDRFMSSLQSPDRVASPISCDELDNRLDKSGDSQEGHFYNPAAAGADKWTRAPEARALNKQPGFVLHPSGSYYLASHFDLSLAQQLAASQSVSAQHSVHPISISVAFIGHGAD